ncbi:MAG: HAD family hydrolase, partial [Myxococcales bacterium]|nr:HAD family hydrolase [Myxococcales bacterium]
GDWLKGVAPEGEGPHDAQVAALIRSSRAQVPPLDAVLFDLDGTLVGPAAPAGVAALLEAVAARYKLALVSDGGGARQRAKLEAAGLAGLFEVVVISQELGAQKPSPRAFAAALERLGVGAARALYVGDDPVRDMAGARQAGLRTCWVARGRGYPERLPAPDHQISDVLGLREVLRC